MEVLAFDFVKLSTQLSNIALAALGLGLVIFLHELGHFAVAKWCNVFVERFSIGFGPVFFSRKWGETEYALSLIPFGGYVKMLGQDDADPSQLTSEEIAEDPEVLRGENSVATNGHHFGRRDHEHPDRICVLHYRAFELDVRRCHR